MVTYMLCIDALVKLLMEFIVGSIKVVQKVLDFRVIQCINLYIISAPLHPLEIVKIIESSINELLK